MCKTRATFRSRHSPHDPAGREPYEVRRATGPTAVRPIRPSGWSANDSTEVDCQNDRFNPVAGGRRPTHGSSPRYLLTYR